eukprot:scaffold14178_cov97-Isochrysis_galbana.AAC.2
MRKHEVAAGELSDGKVLQHHSELVAEAALVQERVHDHGSDGRRHRSVRGLHAAVGAPETRLFFFNRFILRDGAVSEQTSAHVIEQT